MKLVFDIEADGLYDEATQLWCMATKDILTLEVNKYHGGTLLDGVTALLAATTLIGHNIIGFDIPLLKKLGYIEQDHRIKCIDTFTLSCLLNPDRGGHGLDAWGKRNKRYKPVIEDWSAFTPEMLHRCVEDVENNYLTYLELLKEEERY